MFDSIRAAPPDVTGEAVAMRGDSVHGTAVNIQHWATGTMTCRRPCTPTTSFATWHGAAAAATRQCCVDQPPLQL